MKTTGLREQRQSKNSGEKQHDFLNHKQPAANGRIAIPFSLPVRDLPVPSVFTEYTYVLPVKASPYSQTSRGPAHKSDTNIPESGKPFSR